MEDSIFRTIWSSIPWLMILFTYVAIFIDLFFGVIVSYIKRETRSHKMLRGLQSKIFVLFIPIIGIIIKGFFITCALPAEWNGTESIYQVFGVDNLANFPICFLLCFFVLLMEVYSFIESAAKIDVRAKHILQKFNKEAQENLSETKIVDTILRRN